MCEAVGATPVFDKFQDISRLEPIGRQLPAIIIVTIIRILQQNPLSNLRQLSSLSVVAMATASASGVRRCRG